MRSVVVYMRDVEAGILSKFRDGSYEFRCRSFDGQKSASVTSMAESG